MPDSANRLHSEWGDIEVDDIWRIPRIIHSFNPNYKYNIRQHDANTPWELVLYAVPIHLDQEIKLQTELENKPQVKNKAFPKESKENYKDELIIMGKYYEVIKNILQLLKTIKKGFDYIQKQLSKLRYEEAFIVLKDIMEAITSIEDAIYPMKDGLPENNIDILAVSLIESMDKAVNSYEQGKEADLEIQISEDILPAFKNWKEEIERIFIPYVVS